MKLVTLRHLTFKYAHRPPLLNNVNASFRSGQLTLITGLSGVGKSTLLELMAGFYPEFISGKMTGQIMYGHHRLPEIPKFKLSNCVAMLFQNPNFQFTMKTVREELIFTLENRCVPANQIKATLRPMLARACLTDLADRKITTLSGGEKQRIALAIVMAIHSSVILLDEPFANVDRRSRIQIMKQLVKLKHAGKIIIIVDHDLTGYDSLVDQLLILRNGRLVQTNFNAVRQPISRYHWRLPNPQARPVFRFRDLVLGYRKPLVKVADFKFYLHHVTLITGANGSGKSTLFKAMVKLLRYRGRIEYLGRSINQIRPRQYYRHVNLVFQNSVDQFLQITVKGDLEQTLQHAVRRIYSKRDLQRWLVKTHLASHLNQVIYTLSGGQQKALQIIEALLIGAPVILLDEPFQSLDHSLIRFFKQLLKNAVSHHSFTFLIISHQINGLADLFDYHVNLAARHLNYKER